jgi:hypothetical protein
VITIHFGKPEHGWLPVSFSAGAFKLVLDASDVPINPIELLCDALTQFLGGVDSSVLWNLEPAICLFSFNRQDTEVILTIAEAASYDSQCRDILRLSGTISSLITPFYHAIRAFEAHEFSDAHWPVVSKEKVDLLASLVKRQL